MGDPFNHGVAPLKWISVTRQVCPNAGKIQKLGPLTCSGPWGWGAGWEQTAGPCSPDSPQPRIAEHRGAISPCGGGKRPAAAAAARLEPVPGQARAQAAPTGLLMGPGHPRASGRAQGSHGPGSALASRVPRERPGWMWQSVLRTGPSVGQVTPGGRSIAEGLTFDLQGGLWEGAGCSRRRVSAEQRPRTAGGLGR